MRSLCPSKGDHESQISSAHVFCWTCFIECPCHRPLQIYQRMCLDHTLACSEVALANWCKGHASSLSTEPGPVGDQAGRKERRILLVAITQNGLGGPKEGWKTLLGLEAHVVYLPALSWKVPGKNHVTFPSSHLYSTRLLAYLRCRFPGTLQQPAVYQKPWSWEPAVCVFKTC